MSRLRALTLLGVALILLLVGSLGMAGQPPLVGGPPLEFALSDLRGQSVRLSDWRGKVVLVNFWASWCKPCREEMPAIQASYEKLRSQGFEVVAINELEEMDQARAFVEARGYTFQVLVDRDNHVANRCGVAGLPVSLFVDRHGVVQERVAGSLLTEDRIAAVFRKLDGSLPSRESGSTHH